MPEFIVPSVEDATQLYTDEGLEGTVYLVRFWYARIDSRARINRLREVYQHYHDQGFEILTVFLEGDRKEVRGYLREQPPVPWRQAIDDGPGPSMAEQFEVTGVPHNVLIGRNGQILAAGEELRGSAMDSTLATVFEREAVSIKAKANERR